MQKYLLYLLGIILLFRLLRFVTTPLFKLSGFYRYYSPSFFIHRSGMRSYDFHLGTSWDFFRLENTSPSVLLANISEGLVNLCSDIERGNIGNDITFFGNTFYLKEETARKFGFRVRNLNAVELILFGMNYLELCFLYSLSHRKPALIPLGNVKIVFASAGELLANKEKFAVINVRFKQRIEKHTRPEYPGRKNAAA